MILNDIEVHTAAEETESVLDIKATEAGILDGALALKEIRKHRRDNPRRSFRVIRGLGDMRNLAFHNARTSDMNSDAYKKEVSRLMEKPEWSAYGEMDRTTRHHCYKLIDGIDEVEHWYDGLAEKDQLQWQHPQTFAKHAPKHAVKGGMSNKPKPNKKPRVRPPSPEVERLRKLLVQLIVTFIQDKDEREKWLKEVNPDDPNDPVENI